MRELIRLALFIIARTGLFVAVVAWIVAQWCCISGAMGLVRNEVRVQVVKKAWYVSRSRFPLSSPSLMVDHAKDLTNDEVETTWQSTDPNIPEQKTVISGVGIRQKFGLGYATIGPRLRVMVCHWLIVSTFILFNTLLHFIYRKRPEVQPCKV